METIRKVSSAKMALAGIGILFPGHKNDFDIMDGKEAKQFLSIKDGTGNFSYERAPSWYKNARVGGKISTVHYDSYDGSCFRNATLSFDEFNRLGRPSAIEVKTIKTYLPITNKTESARVRKYVEKEWLRSQEKFKKRIKPERAFR